MPYISVKDRRIHYREWPHRAGNGQAPAAQALVLVHGLGASAETWQEVAAELAVHFRLAALDLPGHGGSDSPLDDEGYAVEEQAAGLLTLLDTLGVERAHLAGYALGGLVALAFALQWPERLFGLVLESTSPEALPPELRARLRRAAQHRAHAGRQDAGAHGARDVYLLETGQAGEALGSAVLALALFDGYVERLETIQSPTLILAGEADGAFVQRGAELLHGWIPFSRLVRIAGARHEPHVENPRAFVDETAGFLREVQTAG